MTPATEHFIALLVAILVAAGGGIAALMRISWRMGQVVERLDNHLKTDEDFRRDTRERLRAVEQLPRRRI